MRGPFSKELLLQSGMLQQQTECIAIIYKHLGVLMTPAHLYWLLGQICTVVDPGQGHNRSMRVLLQRTTSSVYEGHSNKQGITQDPAHLYSLLGQICLGADPEQGHNTSMRGPFSKELLQSGMLQQQTECIAIIYKHLGVLMTPAHLYWLLGQIRTVVDPGQGHNRSMRALLQRTTSSELEGHSNKPNV